MIHGGSWSSQYGIEDGRPLAADLVTRGWNVATLEYRRVGDGQGGGGGVPETFDDVAAALDALPTSGLDLSAGPVIALGHSAGGHLAAWAATRSTESRWAGGLDLDAVISQAGVVDLIAASKAGLGGCAVERLLGHAPGTADARYDPIQRPALDIPVICVHDTSDTVVPLAQSSAYVDTVTAAGGNAKLMTVAGDHFTLIDPASDAWAEQLKLLDGLV